MKEITTLEEVKKQPGRSLVFCGAAYCVPCGQIKLYIEDVCKEARVHLFYVDAAKVAPLLAQASVRSLPTLILYRDGIQIGRRSGFMPAAKLRDWLME
jgi:thioredoxin-like negative regulator of GroEL